MGSIGFPGGGPNVVFGKKKAKKKDMDLRIQTIRSAQADESGEIFVVLAEKFILGRAKLVPGRAYKVSVKDGIRLAKYAGASLFVPGEAQQPKEAVKTKKKSPRKSTSYDFDRGDNGKSDLYFD